MTLTFLVSHRNTQNAIEIGSCHNYKKPSLVTSPLNLNIPMRATLNHSLWEQEDPDEHFLQVPVASSLGENFLGPWHLAKIGWSSLVSVQPLRLFATVPSDLGGVRLELITMCCCTSTNKPPCESLTACRLFHGRLYAGEQELAPWENKLLSAQLKPQSIWTKPGKPVQRKGPSEKNPTSFLKGMSRYTGRA